MKITKFHKHYKTYFPVGEGWRKIVEKLVDDIIKIAPNTEINQIKEKFGTLRFYCSGDGRDDIYDLIKKAEIESGVTCERCGTREGVTTEGDWILTLCKKCRSKR
jgi:hypothetical protein